MSVTRKRLMFPEDREGVVVVSIAGPAGAAIELDPLMKVEGWLLERIEMEPCECGQKVTRITVEEPTVTEQLDDPAALN